MLCPACQVELQMTERQGVEIDYCPKCRGVWLDRGELDKILERSAREQAPAAAPASPPPVRDRGERRYGDDTRYRDDRDYHEKRRKKSFLEDLFG